MSRASDFILKIRLQSIDSLVDDRILIYPTKDSNILLKLGKVCRSGSSLTEVLELSASGTLFIWITIVGLKVFDKQTVIVEEVWSRIEGEQWSYGQERSSLKKRDHVADSSSIVTKLRGLKLEDEFTFGNEGVKGVSLAMEGFGILNLGFLNLRWCWGSQLSILIGDRLRKEVHHGHHLLLEHCRINRNVDIWQW